VPPNHRPQANVASVRRRESIRPPYHGFPTRANGHWSYDITRSRRYTSGMLRRVKLATIIVLSLLAAATVALWMRSHWTYDAFAWSRWWYTGRQYDGVMYQCEWARGVGGFSVYRLTAFPAAPGSRRSDGWSRSSGSADDFDVKTDTRWRRLGFGMLDSGPSSVGNVGGATVSYRTWWVPLWFLTLLLASPLVISFVTSRPLRARRRRARGECVTCGYDLRSSPERCPECGTLVLSPRQRETEPCQAPHQIKGPGPFN
jgi:hypothetical protein